MNKSLLIIICDFLLLSLLSLARFDDVTQPAAPADPAAADATHTDLADALKLALEDERQAREALDALLAQTRQAVAERDSQLSERDQRIRRTQENLQRTEAEARSLETERASLREQLTATQAGMTAVQQQLTTTTAEAERTRARLEQTQLTLEAREALLAEREKRIQETQDALRRREAEARKLDQERVTLREQLAATQAGATTLQQQLQATGSEAQVTRQRLEEIQAEARARQQEAESLQKRLATLEQDFRSTETEKQKLAGQLRATETEARMAREQVTSLRGEVQVVRDEKARLQEQATRLTEGLTVLAKQSGDLAEEIRQTRPLSANAIYSEFLTNRVQTHFQIGRRSVFGFEMTRQNEARSVLVEHAGRTCALYHVKDTPLVYEPSGSEWEWLSTTLLTGPAVVPVSRIEFLARDPRVILVPVEAAHATRTGVRAYQLAGSPEKFQEAVLVGANAGYYGECRFQLDAENPDYVRMQKGMFSRLVGNFVPSAGDLVFTKTGELLGLMVNGEYCLLLTQVNVSRSLRTGTQAHDQRIAAVLAQLHAQLTRLPFKLQ